MSEENPNDVLKEVFGADVTSPKIIDFPYSVGRAIKITGRPNESDVEAGQELGEAIALDGFMFGYVDPTTHRAIVFMDASVLDADAIAERVQIVPFLMKQVQQ